MRACGDFQVWWCIYDGEMLDQTGMLCSTWKVCYWFDSVMQIVFTTCITVCTNVSCFACTQILPKATFFLIALSIYFLFIYFCIIFQMFIVIRNGLEFAHINRYSSEPRFIWNEAMYAYVMHVKRIVRLYVNIQRWLIEMQNQSF